MADDDYAKFKNDQGVPEIRIGVKEFKCVGASPPQDHPHIYLEMGAGDSFLSGFFCEYLDGKDPLWCASMGAASSSCILETIGPTIDASLKEISRRAEDIFDRIERL